MFLAVLDALFDFFVGTEQAIGEADCGNEIARGDQHSRQYQFLDSVGIRTRSVEYRNAALAHFRHWNIVGPRTRPADGADRSRNRHRFHIVGAHQDSVRRIDLGTDRIALGRQPFEASR